MGPAPPTTATSPAWAPLRVLERNFSQQLQFDPMACPAGSVGGLHEVHATRLDTALHPWAGSDTGTVRFSGPADVTYRFGGPTA